MSIIKDIENCSFVRVCRDSIFIFCDYSNGSTTYRGSHIEIFTDFTISLGKSRRPLHPIEIAKMFGTEARYLASGILELVLPSFAGKSVFYIYDGKITDNLEYFDTNKTR